MVDEEHDEKTSLERQPIEREITFHGLKEEIERVWMDARRSKTIEGRVEAAEFFIVLVAEQLNQEEDEEARLDGDALRKHNQDYRRPYPLPSVGYNQDGIPVLNLERPGPDKTRHQFMPDDQEGVRRIHEQVLAEHFIRDVQPWFAAATMIAKKRKYLRSVGERLSSRKSSMFSISRIQMLEEKDADDEFTEVTEELESDNEEAGSEEEEEQ